MNIAKIASILLVLLILSGCKKKELDYHHGKAVVATQIAVLDGGEFDIKLVDGERIHGYLPVGAPPDAKDKIIKLINASDRIEVILLKKHEDKGWIVNLMLVTHKCNGKVCMPVETNLVDWLKENSLAWE